MSAADPARRRSIRLWFALAMLLVAVGGAGAYAVREGLKTCGALDIRLGRSGCRAATTLEGFAPMLFETIAVSSKSGRAVLFGDARTPEGWRAAWAEIDLDRSAERRRGPLPMLTGAPNTMRVAPDGRRAVLHCDFRGPCVEGGTFALDVSIDAIEEARPIAGREADRYRSEPPGVPALTWKAPYRALFLPDGETVAGLEESGAGVDELVLRRFADGSEVRRIGLDPPAKIARFDRSLVASRGGRLVALVTASNPPRLKVGTMVRVFDLSVGRQIGTIATDESFEAKPTGAFTPDETGIILVRRLFRPTATGVSVFDLPKGTDAK